MREVTVLHVGNIKDRFFAEALSEYEKRLSAYCALRNIEIKEEKTPAVPSKSEIALAVTREGERLLSKLPGRAYKIALCIEGKELSSESFSRLLSDAENAGHSHVVFIIGGSWGLSDAVKAACDFRLSFSPMTFPHRLMRVLLAEQLYRAYTIRAGTGYHK